MTSSLDLRSLDPKLAAKQLRSALKDRNIDLGHGACLDLVARELGLKDWNVLAAMLAGKVQPSTRLLAPPGWRLQGSHLSEFSGGLDRENTHLGKPVFWMRNATEWAGSTVLLQQIKADRYAGKRVRYSGWMCSESVETFASLGLMAFDGDRRSILYFHL